jgi:hypothetical protein
MIYGGCQKWWCAISFRIMLEMFEVTHKFAKLKCLSDLCAKLMKTNKYNIFDVLYKLMKLALVLSMTSASFEQIFSALKYVKSQLSNKMGDQ